MTAHILCIGDELLIGQVVNSNAAWMGQQLNRIGINVTQHSVAGDWEQEITDALNRSKTSSDIILITGGLGPTKDDITKHTLCKYFNSQLVFDEKAYTNIERLFKNRGREVTARNREQAMLPDVCTPLYNTEGTAPGMWFEQDGKIFVSMPGVPDEMKTMMEKDVLPKLKVRFNLPPIVHKTILTQGIGESFLADLIHDWEEKLPKHIRLAYLPSTGMLKLRLTSYSKEENAKNEVEAQAANLLPIIDNYVFGYDDDTISEVIGTMLRQRRQTLSTAESCTGGYIAHMITSIPGSSDYYQGSVVSYANEIKESFLNVSPQTLKEHGAVSEQTVREMSEHIRGLFKTDYSIATSGIAGPTGGSADKPIGTMWIAVASGQRTVAKKFQLGENRQRIIQVAGVTALNMLRKEIQGSLLI